MENQNSVCFAAKISEVKPIEGADNIELGIIQGWNCIIKKGSYQVGDLVVVATTDAVIPQELSDAMNVTNYLRKGQRVKTVKLRGVYSECLIIPIEFAKQATGYSTTKWDEGDDLMDTLKIFKYEPPAVQVQLSSGRKIRYHQNPFFQVYYKFPNLKNVKGMFTEEDEVEITRKLHGTNSRYGIIRKHKLSVWDHVRKFITNTFGIGKETWKWIDYEFVYGSHNVEKGSDSQGFYDTDVWRTVADKYQIKDKLWEYFKNRKETHNLEGGIIIYGEIYGPGIQKNYDYGLKELTFAGFDIVVDNQYQETLVSEITFKGVLDLPYVPVLYKGQWSQEIQDKYTFDNFVEGTKVPHEGIVIKHVSGNRHKVAKVINPAYLIYGEKHDVGDSH
jgi:RNA ligase (TIGR02306 family)